MLFKFKAGIAVCNEFNVRDLFHGGTGAPLKKVELILHYQSGREISHHLKEEAKDFILSKIPENYADVTKYEL